MNKEHYNIGATFGVFDIFHQGHQVFIKHISQFVDILYIILMDDKKVKEKKNNSSLYTTKIRKKIIEKVLENLQLKDKVIVRIGTEDSVKDLLELNSDIVFLWYDQKFGDKVKLLWYEVYQELIQNAFKPEECKSSIIRERIRK